MNINYLFYMINWDNKKKKKRQLTEDDTNLFEKFMIEEAKLWIKVDWQIKWVEVPYFDSKALTDKFAEYKSKLNKKAPSSRQFQASPVSRAPIRRTFT